MFRQGFALVAVLFAGFGGVAGCTTMSNAIFAQDVVSAEQAEAGDYLIGPGDSLQIFVWDNPDLSTNVTVRPDGRISSPLVDDLQAAGKSPTQLARDVENVLTEFLRAKPVVTVMVAGFVGESAQQIRVVGQAAQPQALQYRQGMTVLDVMIAVGGLSELASGNRARIIRNVDGEPVEIRVLLDDLINQGRVDQNLRMMPGDLLVIPESFF